MKRLFGTIGVQVFSHQEGTTLSRTKDFYDPIQRARLTPSEIGHIILKWIVDDYHVKRHDMLKYSPIEKWNQLTQIYPVRPVPDFIHIFRMTGKIVHRKISNVGVHYEGLLYSDKAVLKGLLARRGALKKYWIIRIDPYDYGEVWILDDEDAGQWHVLPCTDHEISRNVTEYQHQIHRVIAKHNLPKGTIITTKHLVDTKAFAESNVRELFENGAKTATASKAARYDANGETFTPPPPLPETHARR